TTLTQFSQQLIQEGAIDLAEYERRIIAYRDALDEGKAVAWDYLQEPNTKMYVDWTPHLGHDWDAPSDTRYDSTRLKTLSQLMTNTAQATALHRQVKKIIKDREAMSAGEMPCNWGYAEMMAYASLLDQGFNVRLTGQDVGRGTFAHRHAVLHDQQSGETVLPIQQLGTEGRFALYDSLLSEEAVLAFEYGYSQTSPGTLVIWEAQFGDFANGAQVVIDQFITSGEHKWARLSGLTLLLPHGYEGAGPEHSSARLERYLQLSAEHNIQVCVPTTPAQMFHLLRRQMIRPSRKPLIVLTPKSLLRHPDAVSSVSALTDGRFDPVLVDQSQAKDASQVTRVILCSGKVYYDLMNARNTQELKHVAIVRIEQLYPFPELALEEAIKPYSKMSEVIWCQEEPMNQGAWYSSQHHMRRTLQRIDDHLHLKFAGRPASAAPAAGNMGLHQTQQDRLVELALSGKFEEFDPI
ncbi:MAG: 2-oxoglutarate dehydrogenase E1 component, partial [Pseudomonadales bacterium]